MVRHLIGVIAALALAGGLTAGGLAGTASATTRVTTASSPAAVVLTATRRFAASLDAAQRARLRGEGLRLGDLSVAQRAEAMDFVTGLLSDEGAAQFRALMTTDDALDSAAGGGTAWSSDEYRISLLGDPGTGSYFVQFGGRHLALAAIVSDGAVSVNPEFV